MSDDTEQIETMIRRWAAAVHAATWRRCWPTTARTS
jgi:hypothetical protein